MPIKKYREDIQRDYPHNRKVFVLFDVIWGMGIPFAGGSLISAYMCVLESSKALIGFYSIMPFLFGLWQIVNSHLFRSRSKKKWLALTYSLSVLPWFAYSVFFFFQPERFSGSLMLTLFMVAQTFFWAGSFGNEGVRFSMLTQCTPLRQRGMLFGLRNFMQVIITLILWPAAFWLMKVWSEPANYLAAFSIATFWFILCGPTYLATREHHNPEIENEGGIGLRGLAGSIGRMTRQVLRNRQYALFLVDTLIFSCAVKITTYIIVFAKEQMGLSGATVIHFSVLQMVASAVTSIVLGKLADRVGYRLVAIVLAVPLAVGFLIAAWLCGHPSPGMFWLVVSFFLCSTSIGASRMVFLNMAVEILPKADVGLLVSVSQMVMTPLLLVTVPLGGWMIDLSGSYCGLFLLGAVLTGFSAIGYGLTHEPRKDNHDEEELDCPAVSG